MASSNDEINRGLEAIEARIARKTVWVAAFATDRDTTLYAAPTEAALLAKLNAEFALLDLPTGVNLDALAEFAWESEMWTLTVDEVAL